MMMEVVEYEEEEDNWHLRCSLLGYIKCVCGVLAVLAPTAKWPRREIRYVNMVIMIINNETYTHTSHTINTTPSCN